MDKIGHAPSRREYDEWRESQPDPTQWLSSSGIRKAFDGSWAKAKEALNVEPSPDVLARRLLTITRPYKPDELLAGLRAFAQAVEVDYLAFDAYRLWAIEELKKPADERSLKRLALSRFPFNKHFGSWNQAVIAAGFPELTRSNSSSDHSTSQPGVPYRDEELRRALLAANKRHLENEAASGRCDERRPPRQMTRAAYDGWRDGEVEAALARGEVLNLPSYCTIIGRLGSWPQALHWAGLIDEARMLVGHRQKSRPMTDDEVLDFLVKALSKLRPLPGADAQHAAEEAATGVEAEKPIGESPPDSDEPIMRADYRRWRERELLNHSDPWSRPAHDATICGRFADWGRAQALARARRRDPEATLERLAAEVDGDA